MSDLGVAVAGGAVGSVLTATLTQIGKIRLAWAEVALHDAEAEERNQQLVAWVDDETLKLVREMALVTQDHSARGVLYSSLHGGDLADCKAGALRRYRDQEWRAQLFLSELEASEGTRHLLVRMLRRRRLPKVARAEVEPFLERWRAPVTRHSPQEPNAARVLDWTTRTTADALAALPKLPLT
jgi:hypothetical protein